MQKLTAKLTVNAGGPPEVKARSDRSVVWARFVLNLNLDGSLDPPDATEDLAVRE
jgi:hypothetical protein